MDFRQHSLADLVTLVQGQSLSARELVGHALARIEELDPKLNAWAAIDADAALADAAAIDERLAAGDPVGPLAGIPIGVKDLEPAARVHHRLRLGAARRRSAGRGRLAAGRPAAGRRVRRAGQDDDAGVRLPGRHDQPALRRRPATRGAPIARPVGRRAGRPPRWRRAWCRWRPAATAAGRSASRRRCAGCRASRRRRAGCPTAAATPPGSGLFTVKGPMARKIRDVLYALDVCVGPDPTDVFSLPPPHSPWGGVLDDVELPARVLWAPAPGVRGRRRDRLGAAPAPSPGSRRPASRSSSIDRVFTDEPLADWFTMWTVYCERRQGHLRGTPDWERIDPGLREQMDHAHDRRRRRRLRPGHRLGPPPQPRPGRRCSSRRRSCCARPWPARPPGSASRAGSTGSSRSFWAPFTGAYNLTRNPAGSVAAGLTADGMPVGLQVIGPQHADVAVLRAVAAIEDLLALDLIAPGF